LNKTTSFKVKPNNKYSTRNVEAQRWNYLFYSGNPPLHRNGR